VSRGSTIAHLFFGSALAAVLASAQSQYLGSISAEALRHPISRKANKALQKVTDSYLAGDDAGVQTQLQRAIEMPEAAPYALKMKGLLDLNRKDFPAAQSELTQAAVALPWDAEARALLGYVFYCAGDSTEAETAAYKSLEVDPNQPLAHLVIGLAQWEAKRVEAGLQHLRTAANFDFLPAQVLLAKYYERSRQPELAAEEWRLAEKDLRQIPDRRVRQDTETWLESHRDFRQALTPGAIK
jgi:tetratricopeptide (TPR) repeat protein